MTDQTTVLLWCGTAAVLLFAVAGGFVAGVMAAPLLQEWAIRRAAAEIHRMYNLVVVQVERAQRQCAEMAGVSGSALNPEEWLRLQRVQQQFQETFARIAQASGIEAKPATTEHAAEKSRPQSFTVAWIKEPTDASTGLPDQAAYDQNLAALLAQVAETKIASGLLLVRMDKADNLRHRLGPDAVEKLLGRLASVVVRSARDEDLLCRVNGDTLALLCPTLPPLAGTKLSEKIREQVRNHHFRADDTGPEVLVTASFGYANCVPGDTAAIVSDRATDGLARSLSLGRNQLHVHDGEVRALCRA